MMKKLNIKKTNLPIRIVNISVEGNEEEKTFQIALEWIRKKGIEHIQIIQQEFKNHSEGVAPEMFITMDGGGLSDNSIKNLFAQWVDTASTLEKEEYNAIYGD